MWQIKFPYQSRVTHHLPKYTNILSLGIPSNAYETGHKIKYAPILGNS